MVFLFLCLIVIGLIISFIQKYVLRMKDPSVEELWHELINQDWFNELTKDKSIKDYLESSRKHGLLSDPHYIRNIIDKEGHREGFLKHVRDKVGIKKFQE